MAMALDAGAELTDMEFVQFEPSAAVWPLAIAGKSVITTLFYEGAVLRNGKGERFMFRYSDKGECADKDVLSFAIASEIAAGRGTEHGGVAFDASGVGRERLEEAYSAYVKRYRAVGMDIAEQAMEIAPAAHTSLGGVYARPDCSTSVEGLFVCGETLGGSARREPHRRQCRTGNDGVRPQSGLQRGGVYGHTQRRTGGLHGRDKRRGSHGQYRCASRGADKDRRRGAGRDPGGR